MANAESPNTLSVGILNESRVDVARVMLMEIPLLVCAS
jgi:hypothetical protein